MAADDNLTERAQPPESVHAGEKGHQLLELLSGGTPIWNPADHPEIDEAGGAAA